MGQYYTIINLTKKEYITPQANDGAKLTELSLTATALCVLCANSNGRGGGDLNVPHKETKYNYETHDLDYTTKGKRAKSAIELVAGRWASDHIVVQGDYAQKGDKGFVSPACLKKFKCIDGIVRDALRTDASYKQQYDAAETFAESLKR